MASEEGGSRERILRAAGRRFYARGYHATGLDAILETAGVSRSNLYYHFPSKQAVCLAVIERWAEEYLSERFRPILEDSGLEALERLRRVIVGVADDMEAGGCRKGSPLGNLALELSEADEACRRAIGVYYARLVDLLWPVVAEAQAGGRLRAEPDARTLAEMMVAQMEGAVLLAKVHRQTRPLRVGLIGLLELAAGEAVVRD